MSHKPVRIDERRRVTIDTAGPALEYRPRLTTAKGRSPIAVSRVELRYDLADGSLSAVTTWGYLIDERDIERRRRAALGRGRSGGDGIIMRRISVNWRTCEPEYGPDWLLDYIEKYRPCVGVS